MKGCVCWDYETPDAPCVCGARERKRQSPRRRSREEIRAAARAATIPRWIEPSEGALPSENERGEK